MARPKKDIDEEQVRKLAAINCSLDEIGSVLGCSADTLQRRFAVALKEGRDHGKMSLKRKMFDMAMDGHAVMAIWLSKNMLGYTDKVEQNTTAKIENLSPSEVKEIIAKDPFLNANGHARPDQGTKIAN